MLKRGKPDGSLRIMDCPITISSRVVYDRVGHGYYTFMIRAFNENDIGSEISSGFELRIKKPAHLTIWFYAAVVISLGFLVYMIIRLREKNLRTEQKRLLKKIDEKTKDLIVKEEIIKERKKVEKVLIEAKTKAELSEKLKTSFLQNMSHEIRTPMNTVVGFSELLMKNTKVDTKQTEYINVIHTNAENLLTIIDDILDVSQLETNQLKVKQGNCKVDEMIDGLKSKYMEVLILPTAAKDKVDYFMLEPEQHIGKPEKYSGNLAPNCRELRLPCGLYEVKWRYWLDKAWKSMEVKICHKMKQPFTLDFEPDAL